MALFFLIACGIYGLGAVMKVPKAQRWSLIGVLLLAVVGVLFIFPEDHGLHSAFGGAWEPYALLAGFAALIFVYRTFLHRLRARVATRADDKVLPNRAVRFQQRSSIATHATLCCVKLAGRGKGN